MPGRQLAAGATGEGARQLAEAGGAGPIGQTVASVAGGAIPFAGAPTTAASLVDDLSAAYRPGSVVRSGMGPVPPPPPAPPRRISPFDYAAYEAQNPMPRPFETAPNLPPPRTYEEAVDQVQSLQAQLSAAYGDVGRSTSVQHGGVSGMRSLDRRAVLERQLAAAKTELERLRPPAPERVNPPGTSETARAYLERLGMGRVADLGSTRPSEPQAMRRGQRRPGDIRAQTQALIDAGDEQAASILRGLREQGFAFEQEAGPIVYGGEPGTASFTATREYTPTDTPRFFWHGSSGKFDEFTNRPTWFTEDQAFAQQFGDAKPYLLRLTNEYRPTPEESRILSQDPWIAPDPSARQRLLDRVRAEGYDHVNNSVYDPGAQTSYSETILLNPSRENVIPAETLLKSPEFRVGERRAPGTWPSRQRPRAPEPLGPNNDDRMAARTSNYLQQKPFPQAEPQPFEKDYKRPVPPGPLTKTIEGDPIEPTAFLVGRREAGGPNVRLEPDQIEAVIQAMGLPPVQELKLKPSWMGAFNKNTGQIEVNLDLTPEEKYITLAHELGHALDFGVPRIGILAGEKSALPNANSKAGRDLYSMAHGADPADRRIRPVTTDRMGYPQSKAGGEITAEAVRAYLTAPDWFKDKYPKLAAAIRKRLNRADTRKAIQFNALLGPTALASIAASMQENEKAD
jgi:hypothetical protein